MHCTAIWKLQVALQMLHFCWYSNFRYCNYNCQLSRQFIIDKWNASNLFVLHLCKKMFHLIIYWTRGGIFHRHQKWFHKDSVINEFCNNMKAFNSIINGFSVYVNSIIFVRKKFHHMTIRLCSYIFNLMIIIICFE